MLKFLSVNAHTGGVDLSALLDVPVGTTEDQEGSMEGSESDPSGDNAPASKLLKNMGKYKDTNSLVAALRKVTVCLSVMLLFSQCFAYCRRL